MTAYAVYVAALNAFLSTSLFDRIVNQDPITIAIHYTRGWTLFPGTIHAENLSIRSSDSNVEWILRLDAVEFDVSFLALARQRFEVTRARGHGISMRARQKLAVPPADIEDVSGLPPIEGYPAYSMRPAGPPSLERWFDEHYALWTVRLADVVAEDVREVWIDQGRFEGSARVSGGFLLKPIREVVVGPARVEMRPGSRVTLGASTVLATNIEGSADLHIERFDPRAIVDDELFRFISAKTALRARFADPAQLPVALPFYLSSAIEARQLRLEIERGVLRPGTRIELDSPMATVAKHDVIGRGPFDFTAEVVAGETNELRATFALSDTTVVAADATELVRARRLVATAGSHALDFAKAPFADAHVAIDLVDARLADASVLALYLPRDTGLRVLGGAARAQAHVDIFRAEERASGNVALALEAIDLRAGTSRVRGSLDGRLEIGTYRFGADAAEGVTLTAIASKVDVATGAGEMRPRFGVGELRVAARTERLDLASPARDLDVTLSTSNATVSNVELPSPWVPQGHAKVARGRCELAVDAHVTTSNHVGRGSLLARSKDLELDLGDMVARATLEARAEVHDVRLDAKQIALDSGTVKVGRVSLRRKDGVDDLAAIDRVIVKVRSPRFSIAEPLARVDLDLELGGGHVADPSAIDAFLPANATYGFASEQGSFDLRARLAVENGIARGHAEAKARAMGFHGEEIFLRGDTEIDATVARWDIEGKKIDLEQSRIAFENVRGRIEGKTEGAPPGELSAKRVELSAKAKDLDIAAPSLRGVDAKLVLDDVVLPDARTLQFLVPAKDGLRIASGSARAFGAVALSSSAAAAAGTLEIDISHGAIGINETELQGDFVARARFHGFDPETSTIDLSGTTVAMRDVRVRGAAAETAQWSGEVSLEKTTLRLDGRPSEIPRLDGVLRIDADDARPLLGILLRDSLPKLAVGLVKMPRLNGYARVHVSPNLVLLSDVSASGGDVAVRGSYGLYGEERCGAFVVEKGPFSVGIDLAKDGASPHFFNLGAWLGAHERTSRAKAAEALRAKTTNVSTDNVRK